MSETNDLLLQRLFRNYDEEVSRNELIDNKNSQMIVLTGTMYLLNVFYWIIQKGYDKEPIIFFEYTGKQSKYLDDKEFTSIVEYKGKDYDDAERIRDEGMKKWMKKNTQWPMKNMKKESLNYS